jgi:type IV secretion system protein VirB9
MNYLKILFYTSILTCSLLFAAEIPTAGKNDGRVRYITYNSDEVTTIFVQKGAVTRIILEEDESIVNGATGFPSDCKQDDISWCINLTKGQNQIWLKPKDNASDNNLELQTNKRNYSFLFHVLPITKDKKNQPMFRVMFKYPSPIPSSKSIMVSNQLEHEEKEKDLLQNRLNKTNATPKNTKYSFQKSEGSENIVPSMIFDDGRFTYFEFPNNREIPSIFYISPTGEESKINYHVENDLVIVQRTGKRFVLRLGKAVVGVWNESYDENGVAPKDGSTVDGIKREVK